MRNINKKGFTLLEMVAVLVLILVLAGLAIPTYQAVIGETRENAAVLSAKAFRNSIDAYAATQEVAPNELDGTAAESALDGELPSNATATWGTDSVEVRLEFGSDDKCATITLASSVGGSSTVAESVCGSAFMVWGTVWGLVTYSNAAPVAGATVQLMSFTMGEFGPSILVVPGFTTTTDGSGQYSLEFDSSLAIGDYLLSVDDGNGGVGASDVFTVGPGASGGANITVMAP